MPAKRFPDAAVTAAFPEFTKIHYIDAGSYKAVYGAIHQSGKEEVLKVAPLPQDESTEEAKAHQKQELSRLLREIKVLSACPSPFVVRLGSIAPGVRTIDGESCFAYTEEMLPGVTLDKTIRRSGGSKPPETEIKKLLRCLVLAIRALWTSEQKTVHRDIKPANIFSTGQTDRPYVLIDLGIAYNVSEPGLTVRADHIPHTPLYFAPEMVDANFRDTLSYRADLYSAGVSVFEFAAGVHPLATPADTLRKTYHRVITQEPTRLATLRADLSPQLCALIDQLLKKKPALRPGNLDAILNQLN